MFWKQEKIIAKETNFNFDNQCKRTRTFAFFYWNGHILTKNKVFSKPRISLAQHAPVLPISNLRLIPWNQNWKKKSVNIIKFQNERFKSWSGGSVLITHSEAYLTKKILERTNFVLFFLKPPVNTNLWQLVCAGNKI